MNIRLVFTLQAWTYPLIFISELDIQLILPRKSEGIGGKSPPVFSVYSFNVL